MVNSRGRCTPRVFYYYASAIAIDAATQHPFFAAKKPNVPTMNQKWAHLIHLQLHALDPEASKHLHNLCELPDRVRVEVAAKLLKCACQSQHIGNITAARNALSAISIPSACLSTFMGSAIQEGVDLTDEWEYRQLIELLREIESDLLPKYIDYGLASDDIDIREAATEFSATTC